MSWAVTNIFAELYGRWTGLQPHSKPLAQRQSDRIEDIRLTMLDMLGPDGAKDFPGVVRRIHLSGDAQALWYARAELMAALAGLHGEQVAHTKMISLSVLFDGMLPKGMMSRATTLRM
ncbi:hypothetical protein [Ottowia thiooxydans]|uniref:hypothetical protein n=1 Tax=Ottowia thiooxydans TaxID=219182 RepID=UPI0003F6DF76|nr:hypothetical protein [Ottowia thiooxydans]